MTRKKMFDWALNSLAVLTALCAVATMVVNNLKQASQSEERKQQSDILHAAQLESQEKQHQIELLTQKNHDEDLAHQNEVALLNLKHIAESRQRIIGAFVGEKSKPVLRLHMNSTRQLGLAYWDNLDGEDPAHVVGGILSFFTDTMRNMPTTKLSAVVVPARGTTDFNPIEFVLPDYDNLRITIGFTTLTGSYYETLYITYDGRYYEAYQISDYENKHPPRRYVDPDYPYLKSMFVVDMGMWQETKDAPWVGPWDPNNDPRKK